MPEKLTPPPLNIDAERSVLGAVLLDNKALAQIAQQLCSGDFFRPDNSLSQHGEIFSAMLYLADQAKPIDLVVLSEELQRRGQLERCGGAPYIASLADGMPRVSNVEYYARIVKEKANLRRIAHAAERARDLALSANGDAAALLSEIASLCVPVDAQPAWQGVFHSFDEFESSAPLNFAIDGFLQNDGATMIGGLSGHGKTLILLSIAKALLGRKGARLWDLFTVSEPAVRVMYLIPECSLAPFKHRLQLFGLYDCLRPEDGRLLVRTLSKGPTPCLSDSRILYAAKGAHVILDTAVRFSDGDENSATDNQRGLAKDIFALLASGARSVIGAHHSPKPFAKENHMTLENILRGSGDVGAMLTTAWGIKQIDAEQNIIHIQNCKPRDFQPCRPFQIIGRPFIEERGDFQLHKQPGECGELADEQTERDKGGAPTQVREARAANLARVRNWLDQDPNQSSEQLARRFKDIGVTVSAVTIRKYKMELSR